MSDSEKEYPESVYEFDSSLYPPVTRGGIKPPPERTFVTTTTSTGTLGTWETTKPSTAKVKIESAIEKCVPLPTKVTKKVLIAFIEDGEDGEIAWASHLRLDNVTYEIDEVKSKMVISLDLKDVYGSDDK